MLIIFSVAGQRTLNYFKMLPIISRGTEHIQIFRMFSAARQNRLKKFQTVSNFFRLKGNQNTFFQIFCVSGKAHSNIFHGTAEHVLIFSCLSKHILISQNPGA